MINFDKVIDRKNTNCLKYDFAVERGKNADILPFWVADMDFEAPETVIGEINKVVNHGIFGYSDTKNDYFDAVSNWLIDGFCFEPKKEHLVKTPGVVFALATAVKAFTGVGDSVIIFSPVYYPFSEVVNVNDRKLIKSNLVLTEKYEMDFLDFENKIVENKVKLFLLCSPHNPVGRVWTKTELETLADICIKHNVIIVSDEIHMDFVYKGNKHYILPSLSEDYNDMCVLLTAPSKTFNIAGLQVSNVFIKNEALRKKFIKEINKTGYSQLNLIGLIACQEAYKSGKSWLEQLKKYLQENLDFLKKYINENLPDVRLVEPEGTYLCWLDFSKLGIPKKVDEILSEKALVWLDAGSMFGDAGEGFQRINIACPRVTLEEGLERIKNTFYGK